MVESWVADIVEKLEEEAEAPGCDKNLFQEMLLGIQNDTNVRE